MIKLIDILTESMADGGAFKAFTQAAIAKKETQANEGLNLSKKSSPKTLTTGDVIYFTESIKISGPGAKIFTLPNSEYTVRENNVGDYAGLITLSGLWKGYQSIMGGIIHLTPKQIKKILPFIRLK